MDPLESEPWSKPWSWDNEPTSNGSPFQMETHYWALSFLSVEFRGRVEKLEIRLLFH